MTSLKVSELQLANNWFAVVVMRMKWSSNSNYTSAGRRALTQPITDGAHDSSLIASLGDIIGSEAEVSALLLRQMQLILLPLILLPSSLT
jgi:hypothetical protein